MATRTTRSDLDRLVDRINCVLEPAEEIRLIHYQPGTRYTYKIVRVMNDSGGVGTLWNLSDYMTSSECECALRGMLSALELTHKEQE